MLPTLKHRITPSPFETTNEGLRERKRGLSNVDLGNIRTYKLNTSAALQKDFDNIIKDKHKNLKKGAKEPPKNRFNKKPPVENQKDKRGRGKLYLNGVKVKPKDDPFKNFDYFGGGSPARKNDNKITLSN